MMMSLHSFHVDMSKQGACACVCAHSVGLMNKYTSSDSNPMLHDQLPRSPLGNYSNSYMHVQPTIVCVCVCGGGGGGGGGGGYLC